MNYFHRWRNDFFGFNTGCWFFNCPFVSLRFKGSTIQSLDWVRWVDAWIRQKDCTYVRYSPRDQWLTGSWRWIELKAKASNVSLYEVWPDKVWELTRYIWGIHQSPLSRLDYRICNNNLAPRRWWRHFDHATSWIPPWPTDELERRVSNRYYDWTPLRYPVQTYIQLPAD